MQVSCSGLSSCSGRSVYHSSPLPSSMQYILQRLTRFARANQGETSGGEESDDQGPVFFIYRSAISITSRTRVFLRKLLSFQAEFAYICIFLDLKPFFEEGL
eukprot:GHVN01031188.1.p1 GENE.GHVN01031188.1~~GHVN01031188.1.p1  ORF type:complete len:102 (-),score=6.00 GHVN01031188.1:17-322(-)